MQLKGRLRVLYLRFRSIFRRQTVERELDEELRFHLEHKIEEGLASGLSYEQARYRALRAMQGTEQQKEKARDARHVKWLTDLLSDLRYAFRTLRRSPALMLFIVLTLGVAIGVNTATFSMLDALVFRPYPVPGPGEIVTLHSTSRETTFDSFSFREYLDIRDNTRSYSGVIANTTLDPVGFSIRKDVVPRIKGGMTVSANYFRVLGVEPSLGRSFREEEDQIPGRNAVVVLSDAFWRAEFGADPAIVGKSIRLNNMPFTVIGVAPKSFYGMFLFGRPDFYVPLAMAGALWSGHEKNFYADRDDRMITVHARLKRGVPIRTARNELSVLASQFEHEYPKFNRNRGAAVHTQFQILTRADNPNWKFSVIFSVMALAVLLTACTNVAGVLLGRARARRREIAVRLSLGAGRFRLIRLLLTESLLIAAASGLLGVGFGYMGICFLRNLSIPSDLPVTPPFWLDNRVLAVNVLLAILAAVLCGLVPALQSTKVDLVSGTKLGNADQPGYRRLWGRRALVVVQVAISLMSLTASFLMVRGFHRNFLEGITPQRSKLLMAKFDPRLARYSPEQTVEFYKLLSENARAIPGVRSATLTLNPPLGLDDFQSFSFVPKGFDLQRDQSSFNALMDTVDEAYFGTMGVPIVEGRGFLSSDRKDSRPVAVINQQMAHHFWPRTSPIGKTLIMDTLSRKAVEIVGVAQTLKYLDTIEKPLDFVYLPITQHPSPRLTLMLEADHDPARLSGTLREAVRKLNSAMPILELRTYEDVYRYNAVEGPGLAIRVVTATGAIGLLLALAGLYGLVAYNVTQKTREIGIRMAIGAKPSDVLRLLMGDGLALVGLGTIVGIALSIAVERLMDSMLFNAGHLDLIIYFMVVPSLMIVTMLAVYAPARRASRIAPTQALRQE